MSMKTDGIDATSSWKLQKRLRKLKHAHGSGTLSLQRNFLLLCKSKVLLTLQQEHWETEQSVSAWPTSQNVSMPMLVPCCVLCYCSPRSWAIFLISYTLYGVPLYVQQESKIQSAIKKVKKKLCGNLKIAKTNIFEYLKTPEAVRPPLQSRERCTPNHYKHMQNAQRSNGTRLTKRGETRTRSNSIRLTKREKLEHGGTAHDLQRGQCRNRRRSSSQCHPTSAVAQIEFCASWTQRRRNPRKWPQSTLLSK